ncbi:diaminopimelate decarboxylase [Adlercreutzia sp. ZJ138]|uniref:diaminopimelate decarboxylase n=1 Tax=Adlercreutzia sp. ZJ138 TaxID=2709405 RepID=UPI0013EBE623|nr:diaminopimelate decarboxylase [Adlercreutzia sp. ZJ138]
MSLPAPDLSKKADNRTTMDLGAALPLTAEVRDGHLFVGGVDMVELARTEGTALYVMDETDMRSRMRRYRESFAANYPSSSIIYASKAFLNKEAARIAAQEGMWLDVSGGGELACALSVGFPAERVVMHGNNKTPLELREAISAGVGRIVLDSPYELERISQIAGELGVEQQVYMRVTPGVEADTHEYIRTGCEDSKFGFTMRDDFAYNSVRAVLDAPNVKLVGLHCHIGSQIFALHSFREAVDVMVELMARIEQGYGCKLSELDMGGGLGVAYNADDTPSTIEQFAELTTGAVKESCEKYHVALPHLSVEPGRSLVATAGLTLYTVGVLKTLPGIRNIVAIDGGMSDNVRTALYHANYEPTVANKADQPRTQIVTLVGKHCESGDAVVTDMPLQQVEVGDIVAVFGTGAYCYTMSSNYNGQPKPGIAFVKDGSYRVVTRRETYDDIYGRDI